MKKLFLTVVFGVFCGSQAFASGGIVCELETKVKQIQPLGILGETVSVNRISGVDTYRYVATLEITSAIKIWGTGECKMHDQLVELTHGAQVKAGDSLKIHYSFAHDRPGQSTTYTVK